LLFSSKSFIDFGQISKHINQSGILSKSTVLIIQSSQKLSEIIKSIGKISSLFNFLADSIILLASSNKSFSTKLFQILYHCAFKKVFAIAQPIIIISTFSSSFFIVNNFELTFDQPTIAIKGFSGLFILSVK